MSEDADESSKTEEPTQKKLDEAHKQGNYAMSQEIGIWLLLAATLIILVSLLPGTASGLQRRLAFYVEQVYQIPMDQAGIGMVLMRVAEDIFWALWLPVLLLMVAGVVGAIGQTGWHVSWQLIEPKFDKISPLKGFQRLFAVVPQMVQLIKGLAKMAVVGIVAYMALTPMVTSVEHFVGIDMMALLNEMSELTYRLFVGVLAMLTIIAAGDLFWQRYDYNKKMKMTKQEVKDEHKQAEGDPVVKSRIRQLRFERARQRMMSNVPNADVVVTNPTHYAIALKYDPETMTAPLVLAKGVDAVALKIREVAKEHDIPVVENPPLARALYATVDIDEEIPAEHYRAVAELITYVFKLKRRPLRN
ncbi:flagellar biosynthesis protein FlhB [Azospirillum sp.]|uniref:flagellar biosynthesis protein FlhB n=1 Tax=Azospirillum sp. TaxID=34012 RepID=UPI002D5069D0|nr:flagellar biosynthesis protein FlhB [Azospirillum sp.]HYD66600.1 flagellar biosynthesis protein FlhB [Azospirillum sp.]